MIHVLNETERACVNISSTRKFVMLSTWDTDGQTVVLLTAKQAKAIAKDLASWAITLDGLTKTRKDQQP